MKDFVNLFYINIMKNIESSNGFMFWDISLEGEKFFKENWNNISDGLIKMVINQK